jgi:flagellar biosynthesis anti-sigma factor FlgM
MKIDSGAAQQAYAAYRNTTDPSRGPQGAPQVKEGSNGTQRADSADISAGGRLRASALSTVHAAPDTREALVQSLREQVQSGTYKVDEHRLADKLIRRGDIGG